MLVGVVHDPSFGPVVACGAGGTAVELLKDVQVRLTPLSDIDAATMVRSLATYPLLDGYRGAPPADVAALEDVLLRIGALAEGAVIVDARIRVEPAAPSAPIAARRTP